MFGATGATEMVVGRGLVVRGCLGATGATEMVQLLKKILLTPSATEHDSKLAEIIEEKASLCDGSHNMGMLNKLAQTSINVAFTFLSSRNIRRILWTCYALQHLIKTHHVFARSSCVASESRPLELGTKQMTT